MPGGISRSVGQPGGAYGPGMESIDPDLDVPVFEQLAAIIRHRIDSGQIPPRRVIPSKRSLTQEFGVSAGTVERAVQLLRAQGYLRTVIGRGLYATSPEDRAK